jgi:hypothetical protein
MNIHSLTKTIGLCQAKFQNKEACLCPKVIGLLHDEEMQQKQYLKNYPPIKAGMTPKKMS